MEKEKTIIIGVIIVLLLIVIIFQKCLYQSDVYKSFLNGYWEASHEFCDEADIESAHAWFNTDDRSVYFIMHLGDDEFIINKITDYQLKGDFMKTDVNTLECNITFDEDIEPLPQDCKIRIDLKDGALALYDEEDTLALMLYKNCKATCGTL